MHNVDVIVSRWSNLQFGANDGSSFYVYNNKSVNTSLAVNLTNNAGFDDLAGIKYQILIQIGSTVLQTTKMVTMRYI